MSKKMSASEITISGWTSHYVVKSSSWESGLPLVVFWEVVMAPV